MLLVVACSGPADSIPRDAWAADVDGADAAALDVPRPDAGRDAADAESPDSGTLLGRRVELKDGRTFTGEVIATYDHSVFWMNPEARVTEALFQEALFAPFPDDRSITFFSRADIVSEEPAVLIGATFQAAMRSRGIVIQRAPLLGVQYVITGGESYHLEEDGFGHFALDITRLAKSGLTYTGDGTANEDYLVFGDEVFAPAAGYVADVVADEEDLPPGPVDLSATNNWVGIHLSGGYYLYLLHFQQDSIAVEVGQTIEAGTLLGRVGNSGVSIAPHLHLVLLAVDPESDPRRSWSVPVEWNNVHAASVAGASSSFHEYLTVPGGTWVSAEPF